MNRSGLALRTGARAIQIVTPYEAAPRLRFAQQKALSQSLHKDKATHPNLIANQEESRSALIGFKAGGTGLNLTAADTVIHYDPWWNPAVEQQATDRAHRIGQTKKVFVYKLIAEGIISNSYLN